MCSSTWATPVVPSTSSIEPTRTHSMWTAVGARRSGLTISVMPLASVNCSGLSCGGRAGRGPGACAARSEQRGAARQDRGRRKRRRGCFIESCDSRNPPMFSFFRKKPPATPHRPAHARPTARPACAAPPRLPRPRPVRAPAPPARPARRRTDRQRAGRADGDPGRRRRCAPERQSWMDKLSAGLRKTGSSISQVFTGGTDRRALYEELESALLLADTGVKATEFLLDEVQAQGGGQRRHPAGAGQEHPGRRADPAAQAAGKAAGDRRAPAHRDHGGGRQRRRQDHLDRQAHQAPGRRRRNGAAGGGRHLPRRGARAAGGLGRPQQGGDRQPGRRRPGGGELRRGHRRQGARQGRGDRRHRRPPADAAAPDGGAAQDQARGAEGRRRRRRTRCCW